MAKLWHSARASGWVVKPCVDNDRIGEVLHLCQQCNADNDTAVLGAERWTSAQKLLQVPTLIVNPLTPSYTVNTGH